MSGYYGIEGCIIRGFEVQERRVLVFGATSAVAQGVCKALQARHNVTFYFVARNAEKLAQCCDAFASSLVGNTCLDLHAPSERVVQGLLEQADQALGGIDTILLAQGDLFDQLRTEASPTCLQQSLQLNALSVISLLSQTVNFQKQRGTVACKFAVITSVAGDRGRPRNFTYGAAKSAVSIFLQGLRSVYYRSDFEFYDIRLGPVDTPMTSHHEKNFSFSTVELVAGKIASLLNGQRYIVYVPGFWRWVMLVVRLMPEVLFQRLGFLSNR